MPLPHERQEPTLLDRAIALAVDTHAGHRNGIGGSYILHPIRVMLRMTTDEERVVAILHDTHENWPDRVSLERLRDEGYPAHIVDAIDRLTRRMDETYEQMIDRIAESPLATKVKLADIADNLTLAGFPEIAAADLPAMNSRLRAWHRLSALAAPSPTSQAPSPTSPLPVGEG